MYRKRNSQYAHCPLNALHGNHVGPPEIKRKAVNGGNGERKTSERQKARKGSPGAAAKQLLKKAKGTLMSVFESPTIATPCAEISHQPKLGRAKNGDGLLKEAHEIRNFNPDDPNPRGWAPELSTPTFIWGGDDTVAEEKGGNNKEVEGWMAALRRTAMTTNLFLGKPEVKIGDATKDLSLSVFSLDVVKGKGKRALGNYCNLCREAGPPGIGETHFLTGSVSSRWNHITRQYYALCLKHKVALKANPPKRVEGALKSSISQFTIKGYRKRKVIWNGILEHSLELCHRHRPVLSLGQLTILLPPSPPRRPNRQRFRHTKTRLSLKHSHEEGASVGSAQFRADFVYDLDPTNDIIWRIRRNILSFESSPGQRIGEEMLTAVKEFVMIFPELAGPAAPTGPEDVAPENDDGGDLDIDTNFMADATEGDECWRQAPGAKAMDVHEVGKPLWMFRHCTVIMKDAEQTLPRPPLRGSKKWSYYRLNSHLLRLLVTCEKFLDQGPPPVKHAIEDGLANLVKWYRKTDETSIYFIAHGPDERNLLRVLSRFKVQNPSENSRPPSRSPISAPSKSCADSWMDQMIAALQATSVQDPFEEFNGYFNT
ncbi:hypothetical protein BKA70DRAFT_1226143 [Coprinopsis sp. MPI-PUGE-AT-0042]|nr:hypothetical protein BKA70DRAFT_1226143 [Coprinopsis sp. MPI-PUGE-AT-0042]